VGMKALAKNISAQSSAILRRFANDDERIEAMNPSSYRDFLFGSFGVHPQSSIACPVDRLS
jgi:hypothetical protein